MGILDAIQTGLAELLSHKLRSMLTMLGVIFGVAAVIAMVSIGEGAREEALEQIRRMGIDVVHVKREVIAGELLEKAEERSPFGLKFADADSIRRVCEYARRVAPLREVFADVKVGGRPVPVKIVGTTPGYEVMTRSPLERGRFLRPSDIDDRRPVCVLGAAAKREVFGFQDAIGRTVKVGKRLFRVVGVMQPKEVGSAKAFSALRDLNSDVYIPITVSISDFQLYSQQAVPANQVTLMEMQRKMNTRQSQGNSAISEVIVQVDSAEATVPTASVIRSVLDSQHRGIRDYEIIIPAELLRQSQNTQRIFNIVMAAIASISLLVGGIGISLGIGGARAISEYADWRTVVSMTEHPSECADYGTLSPSSERANRTLSTTLASSSARVCGELSGLIDGSSIVIGKSGKAARSSE